jgi:biphenyl 2,3-dioxygenase beta subunit
LRANISEVTTTLRASVEDFYYDEADMLDQFRLRDWLNILTDDVRYRIPIRTNRTVLGRPAIEVSDSDMLLDEDKRTLTQRVVRLETGRAWAEEPRSRSRHLVTNVRVRPAARENEFIVTSNFIAYRNRLEVEQDFFVGTREDLLRLDAGALTIADRLVLLDQAVITAKNMTILF